MGVTLYNRAPTRPFLHNKTFFKRKFSFLPYPPTNPRNETTSFQICSNFLYISLWGVPPLTDGFHNNFLGLRGPLGLPSFVRLSFRLQEQFESAV